MPLYKKLDKSHSERHVGVKERFAIMCSLCQAFAMLVIV